MIPSIVAQDWWMIPFYAALGSITVSYASTLITSLVQSGRIASVSTFAYLALGCSVGVLALGSLVPGTSPAPSWEGPSILLLLFLSAPAYYATSRDQEERSNTGEKDEPAFSV